MNKYNIYKIDKAREADLVKKLTDSKLSVTGQQTVGGFEITMYVSEEPDPLKLWWIEQYHGFVEPDDKYKNKVHCAAVVASNETSCYAVSLGKTHFYLKEFSDPDFGVNLGTRIADRNQFKRKNSQYFGSKKTKGIILYGDNAGLDFDSGESIDYFRARTVDEQKWGKSISFGGSVLLNVPYSPSELPTLIGMIEEELAKEPVIKIPRATKVKDTDKVAELDKALADAVMAGDAEADANEMALSGIEFVFRENAHFTIKFRHMSSDTLPVLAASDLREFCGTHGLDLVAELPNIKVKAEEDGKSAYTKPVKHFLEYVAEPYFLKDGTWHEFNADYLTYVEEQVNTIEFVPMLGQNYSKAASAAWKALQPVGSVSYPERYFNILREGEGYEMLDGQFDTLKSKYTIERLDLRKDDDFIHVKMGEPAKLGYAVDQSSVTIRLLAQHREGFEISGDLMKPKRAVLWFVLDRVTEISKPSEFKSLILLMKLCEWQRACRSVGVEPVILCSYKVA